MAHPDLAAEQAHVDHAYEQLEAMRANALATLRAAFGERGGTFQAITERDIRVRTSLNRLEQLQLGRESLVFGRIDRLSPARVGDAPAGKTDPLGPGSGAGPSRARPATATLDQRGVGSRPGPTASAPQPPESGPEPVPEAFHIGRLAVADEDQEPLVVDWRAPVAEPFYRATWAQPMGLTRRRHFLTEGRRVLDLEDELFGEPAGEEVNLDVAGAALSGSATLLAALTRSRTGRMRDIVATVQREQDEIIRSPLGGIVVVQGGPGTGKTAVALHRAAYLLYTYRFPLESQGVLVVGPNPLFLRYIEHVLPSLGETGVEMSTVSRLYGPLAATGADDRATAALKGDARMAQFLARAVTSRQRPLRRPVEVPYGPVVLTLSPEASAEIVTAAKRRSGTHNARRRLVEQLLWRHLHGRLLQARGRRTHEVPTTSATSPGTSGLRSASDADDLGSMRPLPDAEEITAPELGRELRRSPAVAGALDRMWPVLSAPELLHDLFGAPALIELAGRGLLTPDEQARLGRPRSVSTDAVAWTEADLALLDEARALLGAPRRRPAADRRDTYGAGDEDGPRQYGHIVVDEAQDLTPMQWRMLGRRSLSSSMTIVGDIAQATGSWSPGSWSDALRHLPTRRGSKVVELTVNYRTPSEIMDLAGRVLGAATPGMVAPQSVRSTGTPPCVVAADPGSRDAAVARVVTREAGELADETAQAGTVGVICPPSLLGATSAALADAGVAFGTLEAGALDDTVTVVAVTGAKGLEFDSVVVVEPARIVAESPQGLRALYVALTRTTRRLSIVHAEALPDAMGTPAVRGGDARSSP